MSDIQPYAGPIAVGPVQLQGEWITGPQGTVPARGGRIELVNQSSAREAIPTWAIVLAIVGFFIVTVFSLLFLLAKERRVEGHILVRGVGGDGRVVEGIVPLAGANVDWAWQDLAARANAANAQIAAL